MVLPFGPNPETVTDSKPEPAVALEHGPLPNPLRLKDPVYSVPWILMTTPFETPDIGIPNKAKLLLRVVIIGVSLKLEGPQGWSIPGRPGKRFTPPLTSPAPVFGGVLTKKGCGVASALVGRLTPIVGNVLADTAVALAVHVYLPFGMGMGGVPEAVWPEGAGAVLKLAMVPLNKMTRMFAM